MLLADSAVLHARSRSGSGTGIGIVDGARSKIPELASIPDLRCGARVGWSAERAGPAPRAGGGGPPSSARSIGFLPRAGTRAAALPDSVMSGFPSAVRGIGRGFAGVWGRR